MAKVEMMTESFASDLCGLKFFGSDGSVLLAVGDIDNPKFIKNPAIWPVTSLTLKSYEKLIGVRSSGDELNYSYHFNLQWIVHRVPTKFTLLVLYLNRKEIHEDRQIFHIPTGVMREVIKYVRY